MAVPRLIGRLVLPLIRMVPLGKAPIYNRLVGNPPKGPTKNGAGRDWRLLFDKSLGAYTLCDLNDAIGRRHYYYGYYTPDLNQLIIRDRIGPGDTYIDIGAHKGVFTLGASRVVGETGRVISFEPNPNSHRIVAAELTINGISNCELHNCGLSDEEGSLTLAYPVGLSDDWCTFRKLDGATIGVEVPVRRADAVLKDLSDRGKILVKVDTEGFEHHALLGFGRLLDLENISFTVEVTDEWLKNTGSGAAELFKTMFDHGFSAYAPIRTRGVSVKLGWAPIDRPPNEFQTEVYFSRTKPA